MMSGSNGGHHTKWMVESYAKLYDGGIAGYGFNSQVSLARFAVGFPPRQDPHGFEHAEPGAHDVVAHPGIGTRYGRMSGHRCTSSRTDQGRRGTRDRIPSCFITASISSGVLARKAVKFSMPSVVTRMVSSIRT